MGNGSSNMKTQRTKPRVVIETPQGSSTDTSQSKVTFANKRTGNEFIKVRPQMTDIGTIHSDIFRGGRVRFQRSQSSRLGSNQDMNQSFTSIRSTASGPVDGVWEPTLDPYDRTNNAVTSLPYGTIRNGDLDLNGSFYNRYIGFTERDYRYGTQVDNGLAKVEEI